MTTVVGGGTPTAVVVLLGVVGAVLGWFTGRTLATGGYRLEGESDRSLGRWVWWLSLALGALWAFLAWRIGDLAEWAALPAYLLFAWLAVCLAWIDLDVHRLPDGLVLPAYPALLALLAVPTVTSAEWGRGFAALGSMTVLFGLFYAMAWLSPDAMGFGDVKLAGLIGLAMGWLSPWLAVGAVLAAFVLGGVVALVLLMLRRVGLRGHIAYGPALLLGSLVALAVDLRVVGGPGTG